MRILFISDVYFPRVNGVSTSIRTFRKGLAAAGAETWLIAPEYPAAAADDERVLRQPSRYVVLDPEDRLMRTHAARRAALELRSKVDIVHVHTPFAAHHVGVAAARALGVKVVETYHTFFEEYFHHYVPLLPKALSAGAARLISRRQCNAVDAVIAPSRQMADALRGYGVRTPVTMLPTGLDLAEFEGGDGAAFRARLGIPARRPVMLLVGRVAHEKNIGFILQVLTEVRATLPDVLLVIAGEGPAESWLGRAIQAAGLEANVMRIGYLDRTTALLDCYRAADVFVFASRTETQGLVLLEALALGVPVVSTAVLGTEDVLEAAAGAIVVPEDVQQFAAAVSAVLARPALRASLSGAGRGYVAERWSSAAVTRRLLALYASVAGAAALDATRENLKSSFRDATGSTSP